MRESADVCGDRKEKKITLRGGEVKSVLMGIIIRCREMEDEEKKKGWLETWERGDKVRQGGCHCCHRQRLCLLLDCCLQRRSRWEDTP